MRIRIYFSIDVGYYSGWIGYNTAIAMPNQKESGLAFQNYKREKSWCGMSVNKIIVSEEEYKSKYSNIKLLKTDEVLKRSEEEKLLTFKK